MALRTAVVGGGTVSESHLSGIDQCPRTELVGICDLDEERARTPAERYGITPYFDVDELLADADLDWVHVCTPVQTHRDIAVRAIQEGVPVLVEKPATETVAEVDDIAAASEEHDVPASVVHNHAFSPAVRRAMAAIEDGDLGRVRGVDLLYTGSTTPDTKNRGAWSFELAGGEFEEGLPHPLYLLLRAGGYPSSPDDVQATTNLVGEYEQGFDYDGAAVQYRSADGVLCSGTMLSGTIPNRSLHVHGEEGSLVVDLVSQTVVPLRRDYKASAVARARNNVDQALARVTGTLENLRAVLERKRSDSWETKRDLNGHYYQYDATAKALVERREMPVPMEEAHWTIQLMERIRSAAGTDRAPKSVSPER